MTKTIRRLSGLLPLTLLGLALAVANGLARGDDLARADRSTTISTATATNHGTNAETVANDARPMAATTEPAQLADGARALARAFRSAAAKATPSVVTVIAYGAAENPAADGSAADAPAREPLPGFPLLPGHPAGREPGTSGKAATSGTAADAPRGENADAPRGENADAPREQGGGENAAPDEQKAAAGSEAGERGAAAEFSEGDAVSPMPPPQTGARGERLPVVGLGSGVILSADGLVVTNHHVIADAVRVEVQLHDQTRAQVTRVSSDPASDLAVLQIATTEPLVAATIGDSESLEIGDWVLAIGSPFELEATVSAGIISAKNRLIQRIRRGRLLQTDAAINPGNSGGPLIDLNGDIIGINTAIATRTGSYQGIGFAIPSSQFEWIALELAEHGKVRRAAMGIRTADLNKRIAAQYNLPAGLGVLVHQVISGSAAAQAGLQPRDVILEFAGEPVQRASELQQMVERKPLGSLQAIKIWRRDQQLELNVRLAPREDPTAQPDQQK